MIAAVASELEEHPSFGLPGGPTLVDLDPETAASRYVEQALSSASVRSFSISSEAAPQTEFKSVGAETIPLTGTVTVKFRQQMSKIPIYGSLVTVEMDKGNSLIAMSSSIGTPADVSPVAKASPAAAAASVKS